MVLHALPPNAGKEGLGLHLRVRRVNHLILHTPPRSVSDVVLLALHLDGLAKLVEVGLDLLHLRLRVVQGEEHEQQFRGGRGRLRERGGGRVGRRVGVVDAADAVEDGHELPGEGAEGLGGLEGLVRGHGVPVDEEAEHVGVFFGDAPIGALGAGLRDDGI